MLLVGSLPSLLRDLRKLFSFLARAFSFIVVNFASLSYYFLNPFMTKKSSFKKARLGKVRNENPNFQTPQTK
jgi:hypothetical protein